MAQITITPVGNGRNFFDQFDAPSPHANAISSIESGGNYQARGPVINSGAMAGQQAIGKYQVMESNVGPWTEKYVGRRMTPQEFAANPDAQEGVFKGEFGRLTSLYGPEGAARAWFAGERGMNDPNRRDQLGTTVADYSRKFQANDRPVVQAAQSAMPKAGNFFDQFDMPAPQPSSALPPPQAPKQDIGQLNALGIGAVQGLSANFGDEIAGASAAGTQGVELPKEARISAIGRALSVPVGIARMIYEQLSAEGGPATQAYEKTRDQVRADTKTAQEQYPGTTLAGNLAGGIALPGGAFMQGATLPGRMMAGARVGGIYGGVSGVGEGTTAEDRASRGLVGTVAGTAIGAVAPPLVETGAKLIGAAVAKPVNMIRAGLNPQGAAERAIGGAYRDAARTDPNAVSRLDPSELVPGGPQMVMDTLGGEGRNLARSAANLSGGAKDILNHPLDARFETQGNRFVSWLNNTFNYPNAHAQQQAIDKVEKTVNRVAYAKAYRDGDRPVWSPELERLVGSPAVQDALKAAITTGKDRAINQGFGGFRSPLTVTPDGQLSLIRGPNGVPTFPNLQFWDYARRELSNAANKARRSGADEDASRLGDLAGAMNRELDRLVPTYQDARQGAAKFFGAEDSLEAGQKFVTENFSIPQTRAALAKMSDVEKQLFQDGFVSRYMEILNKVPDRSDVVKKIYNSPAAKEKIEIALGRQRATELEAMIRVEGIMQKGLSAVQGNSTTAAQIIGAGLAGAGGGGALGYDPTFSGVATALVTAGKKGIDARVAQKIAEMLTSNNPDVLNRGIKMIANNGRMMDALRSADSVTIRAGSQQVPTNIPALQAPAVGRSDDQPAVPRPPGQ